MTSRLSPPSPLLLALRRAGAAAPLTRRILVAPSINWARELLRQLARRDGGWIGWEAMTLRGMAGELAFLPLSEARRRAGTDIEIGALVGEALDQAVEAGALSARTRELVASPGFRRALQDALLQLRIAGISGEQLRTLTQPEDPAADLATVLDRYQAELDRRPFTDTAGVFAAALAAFDEEAPLLLDGVVYLAPDLTARGLPGLLLRRLLGMGAHPIERTPDGSQAAGERDCFLAATPTDEVREALRRVVQEGLRLDEVELVATDVDTYGSALDSLSRQVELPVTLLQGLPLARSRMGRALNRWFAWLEGGLPADLLRQLLESGDLSLAEIGTDGPSLSRALRSLRIGWGRERYASAVALLQSPAWAKGYRYETESDPVADPAERIRQRTRVGADLALFLTRMLEFTPAVPERGDASEVHTGVADLAAATLRLLDLIPVEGQSTDRLRVRLQQIAAVPGPVHRFGAALAGLREGLADFRVWTDSPGAGHPWSSRGGALHLTDLAHAGLTGRRRVFVLGLDADRAAGPRIPDPFLPDRLREALGADRISTSGERRREYRELLARTLAGLPGRVSLSYAAASDLAGHETGPAPALLEIVRQTSGQSALSYSDFRAQLGAPASAVPATPGFALDARDHWLGAIAVGPLLQDGTAAVLAAWPGLAAGVAGFAALEHPAFVPHLGLVTPAAGRHDPTRSERGISPTALELLARCPLAWFYQYALRLAPPDDPEYDPDHWLDPLQRGAVLHAIYEDFVQRFLSRPAGIMEEPAIEELRRITARRLAELALEVPPPSETVRQAEDREILAAAFSFLAMERESFGSPQAGRWLETELRIDSAVVRYALPDGSAFPVRGKIDRVDQLADGRLVIVDYKTGRAAYFREDPKLGPFRGGRHLQPAIYATAAGAMRAAEVARFEYRFPTPAGQNDRAVYPAAELTRAPGIIQQLVQLTREGQFLPTNDHADCTYCDFQRSCRVQVDSRPTHTSVTSPRAKWAKEIGMDHPALQAMRNRRGGA